MTSETKLFNDEKARTLEEKGLYRRAAHRWLDVLMSGGLSVSEQQDAMRHRRRCLAKVKRPSPESMNFSDVSRAAKATQDRMGLSRPGGTAFRLFKD